MKKLILTAAALALSTSLAFAQGVNVPAAKKPDRDYYGEVKKRMGDDRTWREKCLVEEAKLRPNDDFRFRPGTTIASIRDGAWTDANAATIAKCIKPSS